MNNFKLNDKVIHPDLYNGKEIFKVVGIRENELELEGDWSGGTHPINAKSWHKLDGIILYKSSELLQTKIISAFPGTGKTTYNSLYPDTSLDLDSSRFSYYTKSSQITLINNKTFNSNTKIKNPNFPNNYIQEIRNNIGKYDIIFVSSHKDVREALIRNCIFFYLVYPYAHNNYAEKFRYLERYKERGDNDEFINLVDNNWDEWLTDIDNTQGPFKKIMLQCYNIEEEIKNDKNFFDVEVLTNTQLLS